MCSSYDLSLQHQEFKLESCDIKGLSSSTCNTCSKQDDAKALICAGGKAEVACRAEGAVGGTASKGHWQVIYNTPQIVVTVIPATHVSMLGQWAGIKMILLVVRVHADAK